MWRALAIMLLYSLFLVATGRAQSLPLTTGKPVRITPIDTNSYSAGRAAIVESSPRHMMICGEVNVPRDNALFSYIYTTADDGRTWRLGLIDRSSKWVSEESCAYGRGGTAYFTTGESNFYNGITHHEEGMFHLFRSKDFGTTWITLSRRPFIDATADTVDQEKDDAGNTLYIFANAAVIIPGKWWGQTGSVEPRSVGFYHAVLLTSYDGGVSFQQPVRAHPPGFDFGEAFAGGSSVLMDGTPIAVDETSHDRSVQLHNSISTESRNAIDVLVARDHGKTLALRATVRDAGTLRVWPATIVQDRSRGPFRGRLYVSWIEASFTHSAIHLATSDDAGYHWVMYTVVQGSPSRMSESCASSPEPPRFSPPALTVNRDGLIGLAWTPNDDATVRFALSSDGGRTFQPSIEIAGCLSTSDTQYLENGMFAWPYDAHLGEQNAAIYSGGRAPIVDPSKLGLSINVQSARGADVQLLADGSGTFHAFWVAVGPGDRALWTRSITVGRHLDASSAISGHGTQSAVQSAGMIRHAEPSSDGATLPCCSRIDVAGLRDITASVAFDFSRLSYDARTGIFTISVSIINKGRDIIRGPLRIVALGLRSDFGVASALNATATSWNRQPIWDVSNVVPKNGLKRRAQTASYVLRFKVTSLDQQRAEMGGSAVATEVRIFGN